METAPQMIAVIAPSANGSDVHAALVTSKSEDVAGLIDTAVHDGAGLIGKANVTIFPDLAAPHPAAGLPLFDSFASAKAAAKAYADKGLKFICAYLPHAMTDMQDWLEKEINALKDLTDGHAATLSKITAKVATDAPAEVAAVDPKVAALEAQVASLQADVAGLRKK